jgi:hypothetical protein
VATGPRAQVPRGDERRQQEQYAGAEAREIGRRREQREELLQQTERQRSGVDADWAASNGAKRSSENGPRGPLTTDAVI